MLPVDLSVGLVSKFFGVWLLANLLLGLISGDRRLRLAALLFVTIWLITIVPQLEILASSLCFLALSRLQIRKPGERSLCWWLVPLIAAEFTIFMSQLIYLFGDYMVYWYVIQIAFSAQLLITTIVGAGFVAQRLSALRSRRGQKLKPPNRGTAGIVSARQARLDDPIVLSP